MCMCMRMCMRVHSLVCACLYEMRGHSLCSLQHEFAFMELAQFVFLKQYQRLAALSVYGAIIIAMCYFVRVRQTAR